MAILQINRQYSELQQVCNMSICVFHQFYVHLQIFMVYFNYLNFGKGICHMRISARNQLKGRIIEIQPGAVNAVVVLDIGGGNRISSSITMESVKNLDLKIGDEAYAIIKASSVMIGIDY